MNAAADRFRAEAKALIDRRREEIIAELAACEPSGPLDPDETPELMAQVIVEHEVDRAAGVKMIPHEEVVRTVLAPSLRWKAYRQDPATLPADEREALERAGAIIAKEFGLKPPWWIRARESARSAVLADIIACLALRREEWEPDPPEPRPFYPVQPGGGSPA